MRAVLQEQTCLKPVVGQLCGTHLTPSVQAILCLPAAYELRIVLHVYKHTYKAVLSVQYSMCYIDYCTIYIYVYILGCIVCMCYILPSGKRSEANDCSLFEIPLYLQYIYIYVYIYTVYIYMPVCPAHCARTYAHCASLCVPAGRDGQARLWIRGRFT